jgi:hypothetical protein
MAEVQIEAGSTASAKEAIELAQQAALGIENASDKEWRYYCIAEAHATVGDRGASREAFELAKQAAAAIEDALEKRWAYGRIAQAQARAGEVETVRGWVEKLTEPEEVVDACLGAVRGLLGEEEEKEVDVTVIY